MTDPARELMKTRYYQLRETLAEKKVHLKEIAEYAGYTSSASLSRPLATGQLLSGTWIRAIRDVAGLTADEVNYYLLGGERVSPENTWSAYAEYGKRLCELVEEIGQRKSEK
jgi:hypothetical protein